MPTGDNFNMYCPPTYPFVYPHGVCPSCGHCPTCGRSTTPWKITWGPVTTGTIFINQEK